MRRQKKPAQVVDKRFFRTVGVSSERNPARRFRSAKSAPCEPVASQSGPVRQLSHVSVVSPSKFASATCSLGPSLQSDRYDVTRGPLKTRGTVRSITSLSFLFFDSHARDVNQPRRLLARSIYSAGWPVEKSFALIFGSLCLERAKRTLAPAGSKTSKVTAYALDHFIIL